MLLKHGPFFRALRKTPAKNAPRACCGARFFLAAGVRYRRSSGGGAGDPGRELVRNAGLKAAEQTEEETRAGKEQRAGKEYATLHGGSPHGGAD